MKKNILKSILFCWITFIAFSCNKKESNLKENKNSSETSNESFQLSNQKKVLYFDNEDPSLKGLKFSFSKNDVEWNYENSEIINQAYLENGEIKTNNNSSVFIIQGNNLTVIDGSGVEMRYLFNRKKSSNKLNEVLFHESESNLTNTNGKPSFAELRGTIIQGSEKTVKNYIGEPDFEMNGVEYSEDVLKYKLGVGMFDKVSDYLIWSYNSADNSGKEILVIFKGKIGFGDHYGTKVEKVIYSDEVNHPSDIFN
ncbi:hypothetical protein [Flavobacterium sp. N1719]|uniref:hypothetical protein n=1 Tax=Flavobacterium sp. N1719 TaxID=2885633 RepID=UPI0022233626|nr:hypothetical protein [Flavobacterium sp. N1719]